MDKILDLAGTNPLAAVVLLTALAGLLFIVFGGLYYAGDKLVRVIKAARGKNGESGSFPVPEVPENRRRLRQADGRPTEIAALAESTTFRDLVDSRATHKAANLIQERVMPKQAELERSITEMKEDLAHGGRKISLVQKELTDHRVEFAAFCGKQDAVNEHNQQALDDIRDAVGKIAERVR